MAAIELLVAIRELGVMKLERLGEEEQEEKSNDSEELHRLAAKGQTAILKKLVTSGADVSKPDFDGRTPLVSNSANGGFVSLVFSAWHVSRETKAADSSYWDGDFWVTGC